MIAPPAIGTSTAKCPTAGHRTARSVRLLDIGLLVAVACAACIPPPSRVVYEDTATTFTVRHNELFQGKAAEVGEVHPAVLEYVLGAGEGPLPAYYDLVLAVTAPSRRVAADLSALAPEATRIAGGAPPRGIHYARALARKLAPNVNLALAKPGGSIRNEVPTEYRGIVCEGTAALWWGAPADLDAGALLRDFELEYGQSALRTIIYRYESTGMIVLRSSGTGREYAWDVGRVAGAFDPRAALDYDRVAASIVALHPYTTPPGSPR